MAIRFTDTSPNFSLPIWLGIDASPAQELPVVHLHPQAYEQAMAHLGKSSTEQGGLLLGCAWASKSNPSAVVRIEILEAIASPMSDSNEYSLRMGAQVWQAANHRLELLRRENQPNDSPPRVIGWFHSHPNLGAFFSSTDRTTQAAFFNHPCSLGWVIDPFSKIPAEHQALYLGADSTPVSIQLVDPSLLNRL
jgi:JAB1/Mov34/MPN/PAD-1 ubiquitin protease